MSQNRPYEAEGKKLEALLNENNLNQSELSRRLGVTEAAVSKWISGMTAIGRFNRKKLELMFKLRPGYFDSDPSPMSYGKNDIILKAMDLLREGKISEETLLKMIERFGE